VSKTFLLEPAQARERLTARYRNQCRTWLAGGGSWPLRLALGVPSERQAADHLPEVRAWQEAWAHWRGPAKVRWTERRWPTLGTQRLPEALELPAAEDVAAVAGRAEEWSRARLRFLELSAIWPALGAILPRHLDVLTGWTDAELRRLVDLLRWLASHPRSNLYLRQLPVPGIDSKWLETRQKVVKDGLRAILNDTSAEDVYEIAGLRRMPVPMRMRLLDPGLRHGVGGLSDIQAPVAELASLKLPVERALIVENLQTGLALEDLRGAVAFMGRGYAVKPFEEIPWLRDLPCHYWGDMDTHGFAILDRLRLHLPQVSSVLMDEPTLLEHRDLWSHEADPAFSRQLPRLDEAESATYQALREGRWGPGVRLEQERIPWPYAVKRIADLAGFAPPGEALDPDA
jgi:hypothetical protein